MAFIVILRNKWLMNQLVCSLSKLRERFDIQNYAEIQTKFDKNTNFMWHVNAIYIRWKMY